MLQQTQLLMHVSLFLFRYDTKYVYVVSLPLCCLFCNKNNCTSACGFHRTKSLFTEEHVPWMYRNAILRLVLRSREFNNLSWFYFCVGILLFLFIPCINIVYLISLNVAKLKTNEIRKINIIIIHRCFLGYENRQLFILCSGLSNVTSALVTNRSNLCKYTNNGA